AAWAMFGGFLSAILCIGFQPLLEWLFNIATSAKLIELSNPNHPLLRRLLLEAPGTYHHSIIVANLAEAASNAIGGNGLLARVGAYYHDVGKLKRPMYFKENQMGDNPHDRTDPRVSTAIVTAHTRDGYQMAQKARIPHPVLDIIRQHHGDTPVLFFYDKATKLYGDETDISAFRYEGPRPSSKEAAAVMLADTIEAAARSIPNPTPEKIDTLIRKLVRAKMEDGQLNESDLTFKDMERICSAFSTVLTGVFHERIEYPDVAIPARAEMPEPAEAPAADTVEDMQAPACETPAAELQPEQQSPDTAPDTEENINAD
ncbi:MAG: HDIG domain-containing protein, partial [Clostridia bacterium]|nr:HDIG domain-containing protein [Clostridia bacterium]